MSSSSSADTSGDDSLNAESKDYIIKMQMNRYKIFKEQDLEKGRFDATFKLEGKLLHAHAIILTSASETLDSWLSARWTKKNETIKVETYSYSSFYELLCFLYSGKCELTTKNVREMIDISEFFAIPDLKKLCDKFFSRMENFSETIEEFYEFVIKYSLHYSLCEIEFFADFCSGEMYKSEKFLTYKKPFIVFLSTVNRDSDYEKADDDLTVKSESEFFELVYKWAERQVMQRESVNDGNFDLQEAVKTELETILPNIRFSNMKLEFLMNFVLEKGFILSPDAVADLFHEFPNHKIFDSVEYVLISIYELIEKQALKKKMIAGNDESFNIANSIKSDFAEIIPFVYFLEMDKKFLMDFIVAKGIITEEQASHVDDTLVEITNNGETISGVFKDEIGILVALQYFCHTLQGSNTEQRLQDFKFSLPKHLSTVTKTKGIDWHLCLEKDGVLAFKHYSAVQQSDYIITEMKSETEFKLNAEKGTYLTASYRNVYGW